MDEMIGRVDRLKVRAAIDHWKAKGLDYSAILHQPPMADGVARRKMQPQNHGLEQALDHDLIRASADALEHRRPVVMDRAIRNVHRAVGTMLGYEVTRRWGGAGLPDDTITVRFTGSAGQSFGAFIPSGITLALEGDANDYVGKGLSGGRIIVAPPRGATFAAEDNVIAGNVALYGATSGAAFIRGVVGEALRGEKLGRDRRGRRRRRSRLRIHDGRPRRRPRPDRPKLCGGHERRDRIRARPAREFDRRCNLELVELEPLDREDLAVVRDLIARHVELTGSHLARTRCRRGRNVSIEEGDAARLQARAHGRHGQQAAAGIEQPRGGPWVRSPASSRSNGRSRRRGRLPNGSTIGARCRCPTTARCCGTRPRAAWIAASRSAIKGVRSGI
jgi:glutamate synthase domain-containing protein 3